MFSILFEKAALAELDDLRAFDRARLVREIERHLRRDPQAESHRKKTLRGLVPPWDQVGPVRQLRVGGFRVFYDVDDVSRTVIVRSIRSKPPHRSTEDIL